MKKLLAVFLLFFSLAAMASEDVYLCTSGKGTVVVRDFEDGSVELDLSGHQVIFMDHAYDIFSAETYQDFVLNLSPATFVKKLGAKFNNNFNQTVIKSAVSQNLQTCRISFNLDKYNEVATLTYNCSTLFKNTKKLDDVLTCAYSTRE